MKQHIHAKAMKQLAEDALKTDEPWLLWEFNHNGTEWNDCEFIPQFSESVMYRRKEVSLTILDWQRVIDEGFYVWIDCGNRLEHLTGVFRTAQSFVFYYNNDRRATFDCEIVREIGIRQPHFKGDKHPEGDTLINYFVAYENGAGNYTQEAKEIVWDDVREYIVLT